MNLGCGRHSICARFSRRRPSLDLARPQSPAATAYSYLSVSVSPTCTRQVAKVSESDHRLMRAVPDLLLQGRARLHRVAAFLPGLSGAHCASNTYEVAGGSLADLSGRNDIAQQMRCVAATLLLMSLLCRRTEIVALSCCAPQVWNRATACVSSRFSPACKLADVQSACAGKWVQKTTSLESSKRSGRCVGRMLRDRRNVQGRARRPVNPYVWNVFDPRFSTRSCQKNHGSRVDQASLSSKISTALDHHTGAERRAFER